LNAKLNFLSLFCEAKQPEARFSEFLLLIKFILFGGVVNKPSVQTMAKIAKALGVSIEELLK